MTRKEVVEWLESLKKEIGKAENRTLWHYAESIDMAIKALEDIERWRTWSHTYDNLIEELRKYARKWSEWNGFDAAMPVLPSTNIRLLYSAADTIEALDRSAGEWVEEITGNGWNEWVNLTCDQCGAKFEKAGAWLYCPMCGAKMYSGEVNDK